MTTFPRPKDDNGIGIHLWPHPYLFNNPYLFGNAVDVWLDRVVAMKFKWVTTLNTDLGFMLAAAARGLQVVCRPFYRASKEWGDDGSCVENMLAAGLTPLIQLYNEPELLPTEWEGAVPGDVEWAKQTWANRWLAAAKYVFSRGGWPGIQVLDPEWYRYLLTRIRDEAPELLPRLWFSCHNYASNHPPGYPYDSLNPGKTIEDDWFCILSPLKFDRVARAVLGVSLPAVCTEGGYAIGDAADNRYPAITAESHRDYTLAMFEMFRTGIMTNGDALPDWWIAVTPWLLCAVAAGGDSAFENNAWYSAWFGERTLTIEAVKALPAFTRQTAEEGTKVPELQGAFKQFATEHPDVEVGQAVSDAIDVYPDNRLSLQMTTKGLFVYQYGVTLFLPAASPKV